MRETLTIRHDSMDRASFTPGVLTGIGAEQLAEFRERAVPEQASAMRDAPELRDDPARTAVPSLVIATGFPARSTRRPRPRACRGWPG